MKRELFILGLFLFSLVFVSAEDRFVIGTGSANNTVIDSTTDLMWDRSLSDNMMTWASAKDYCENLSGFDGHGEYEDWRLPNIYELQTLVDFNYILPALSNSSGEEKWVDGDPFYFISPTITNATMYIWSATNSLTDFRDYWTLYAYDGKVIHMQGGNPWAAVLCVRGSMFSKESSVACDCPKCDCPICADNCPAEKEVVCPNATEPVVCPDCPEVNTIVDSNNCAGNNLGVSQDYNMQQSSIDSQMLVFEKEKSWMINGLILMGFVILVLFSTSVYFYLKLRN